MKRRTLLLLLVAPLVLSPAQPLSAIHNEGEARDRTYDVLHYRIEVSFDEMKKSVAGRVTMHLVPFLPALNTVELDAEQMQVHRVSLGGGGELGFDLRATSLLIHLDHSYSYRDTLTLSIEYSCTPMKGLYFTQPDSGYPDKPWQIWTQGEDMDNHFWFPCYDFPNDRATSEVLATVRSDYTVLSNGRLARVTDDKTGGTRTFHWKQEKPHVSYLIALAAGRYTLLSDTAGSVPLQYYVYADQVEDAKACFRQTADMMRFFNEWIGIPYPWEKYAQVIIADLVVGGMENTSAGFLLDNRAVYDARARLDDSPTSLIAHELAHQWWGDLVTCKDWRHLWLNEGFASYFDPLYHEYLLGRDEFDHVMHTAQLTGITCDKTRGRRPIVSVESYGSNLYSRGAAVLHMLRFQLGDELFLRAMRHYIQKHQFTCVETNDFKRAIEDVTGQNLFWFFDQWVYRAGYPIFNVSYVWDDSMRTVLLSVKQVQTMDSLTGTFRTPVDIEITTPQGMQTHRITLLSKDTIVALPAPARPRLVIFDAGNWLLKELQFQKSNEEWNYQAEFARNPVDRIRALVELRKPPVDGELYRLLARLALGDPFWAVRREAVISLGDIETVDDSTLAAIRQTLCAAAGDAAPAVRSTAANHLGKYHGENVFSALHTALRDSSYSVVASALRSLATSDSSRAWSTIEAYLDTPSHGSILAATALVMLGKLDPSRVLPIALQKVRYGQPSYLRIAALDVLGRCGRDNPDVIAALTPLILDKNRWIRLTAIQRLGLMGDESVVPALEQLLKDADQEIAAAAKASIVVLQGEEADQDP